MHAHAVEGFPEEVCGVVFASPNGQVVRRMQNVQNALHAADPVANPRDARTAYQFDAARAASRSTRQGDEPGWRIVLFYHSHPQHGAYFSRHRQGAGALRRSRSSSARPFPASRSS